MSGKRRRPRPRCPCRCRPCSPPAPSSASTGTRPPRAAAPRSTPPTSSARASACWTGSARPGSWSSRWWPTTWPWPSGSPRSFWRGSTVNDIVAVAREQVLERGGRLTQAQILSVLRAGDDRLGELLALAHEVRLRWCGPEVEVEGIVSLKTGGCPEDCHFCSQSGQFSSPVRPAWLDIGELVEAARRTRATGATEFCIVAAVRGPDARLMAQLREGVTAIRAEVDIQVAASLGILSPEQADELAGIGVHRYNHNLETARSYFPQVVTTHTWAERWTPACWCAGPGWSCAAARWSAWAKPWSSAPSWPRSSASSA